MGKLTVSDLRSLDTTVLDLLSNPLAGTGGVVDSENNAGGWTLELPLPALALYREVGGPGGKEWSYTFSARGVGE